MFVYGSLDMAGLEVLSTLPVTNLWVGRIVKVGDQVFVYGSTGWSTVSVPIIDPLDPLIEGKILSNDGVKPIWVEQYPDMATHQNDVLRSDGIDDVFWDSQYPPMAGHEDDILHSDGLDGVYWKPQYPDMTGHLNHILISDGIDEVHWTSQYPDMTGLVNYILRTNGIDYVFWDNQYPDQTGHVGQFLQTDGFNVAWANTPAELPAMALKQDWLLTNTGMAAVWTADPSAAIPGQFLQWDGAQHVWATPPGSLPVINIGDTGLFLSNDGVAALWRAIDRAELVPIPGEADYVLINDGSGVISSEQWLNQTRGGFGQDVSGFQGFVQAGPAGQFFAQPLLSGDIPSGIPADNIGSGNVDNAHFDQLVGIGRYESTANIAGGVLSVNADPTKFDLSGGDGVIVDYSVDPHDPTWTDVPYAGGTALTVTNLLTADQTYIMINPAGAIVQQATYPSPTQLRDNIYIGVLAHANRTTVSAARSTGNHAESVGNHMFDFWNAVGPFNILGNTIAPNGATLTFQKSAGFMFSAFYNQVVSPKDPHRIPTSSAAPVSFGYRTQSSSLGGTPADQTLIDPTRYDLAGVVTAIGATATNATVQRVFLLPTGQIRVQYGQQIYTNLAQALANMGQELFVPNPALVGYAILIGYIVLQQNATTLNSTLFARVFSAARFEVGPAAGALPSTTQQQAYTNSDVPMIVLNPDVGAFNLRDASTPLGTDLFSVTDFAGTAKYIQVDVGGIKSPTKISPSLALVSDASGAIVSLAGVTAIELGFITDVTGNIQAQLNTKANIGGTLAQFSPTTSDQLAGVMTDETGWAGAGQGLLVFNFHPTLINPIIDNGLEFFQETTGTAVTPAPLHNTLYPKADNKWYSKDSGGTETAVGGGGGLVPVNISSGPATAVSGNHYLTDTTAGPFTINLPAGSASYSLKFTDAFEKWGTNNLTITPATGEKIDLLAINESLVCDVIRGWVELNWNGSFWVFGSMASTSVGDASATSGGIVNTTTQTLAGNKTFTGITTLSGGVAGTTAFAGATSFAGALTPAGGIVGKTDGVDYGASFIGQKIEKKQPTATAFPGAIGGWGDATFSDATQFITVPAGIWSLNAVAYMSGGTLVTQMYLGIGQAVGSAATDINLGDNGSRIRKTAPGGEELTLTVPNFIVNLNSSAQYRLKLVADYPGGSNPNYTCRLTAIRIG